jgi:beta-galactosidase
VGCAWSRSGGADVALPQWQIFRLGLDPAMLAGLKWQPGQAAGPAFWRGQFTVEKTRRHVPRCQLVGQGVVWVNGHCLGRFWNIGPTQTMYLPGPWLRAGRNDVVVLDLLGPQEAALAGCGETGARPAPPRTRFQPVDRPRTSVLRLDGLTPVYSGSFAAGPAPQEVRFARPVEGRQFCLEMLSAHDGKPFAAIAELDSARRRRQLPAAHDLDHRGGRQRGAGGGKTARRSTRSTDRPPTTGTANTARGSRGFPHQLAIDLGAPVRIGGFRYTPRAGNDKVTGRIKDYRVFIGDNLVPKEKE